MHLLYYQFSLKKVFEQWVLILSGSQLHTLILHWVSLSLPRFGRTDVSRQPNWKLHTKFIAVKRLGWPIAAKFFPLFQCQEIKSCDFCWIAVGLTLCDVPTYFQKITLFSLPGSVKTIDILQAVWASLFIENWPALGYLGDESLYYDWNAPRLSPVLPIALTLWRSFDAVSQAHRIVIEVYRRFTTPLNSQMHPSPKDS